MIKKSLKRLIRDKSMWVGYLSVLVMFFATSFYPLGMLESANAIINNVEKLSITHKLEDGFFETYVPLTKENKKSLITKGAKLEEHFSVDIRQSDGSVLRVTTPREKIDIQHITSGQLPNTGQIVIERVYASIRGLSLGDQFKLLDKKFTISGFMALPDYEAALKNVSDTAADGKSFGLVLLEKSDYENFKSNHEILQSETLNYAFILGKDENQTEFKERLLDLRIPINKIKDEEFKNYVNVKRKDIDEILDKLDNLDNGVDEYEDAIVKFKNVGENFESEFDKMPLPNNVKLEFEKYFEGTHNFSSESFNLIDKLKEFSKKAKENMDKELPKEVPNLSFYLGKDDNPRIFAAVDDKKVDIDTAWPASILAILLSSYAITVLIGHVIEKEKPVIGTLTALGVKKRDIILSYTIGPTIIVAIGSIFGIIGAYFYNIKNNLLEAQNYFSLPNIEVILSKQMFFLGFLFPVIITFLITVFFVRKKLNETALSLIRNEDNKKYAKRNLNFTNMSFERKFRLKFLYGEKKSILVSLLIIFFSLWLMMIGIHTTIYCAEIANSPHNLEYEHMYAFKYPQKDLDMGGEVAYVKDLNAKTKSYNFQVNVIGIEDKSMFFPKIHTKGNKELAISEPVALKFGLKVGDEFSLSDKLNDLDYRFTVAEIVDYPHGLHVFMPVEKAAKLFGEEGERNAIFSKDKLNIKAEKLEFHLEKQDMIRQGAVFMELMTDMINTMKLMGIFFVFFILLQTMKIMTDRAKKNISLFKVLGYDDLKVQKLFLLPQWFIIVIGIAVALPLAKLFMDKMFPYMIGNVPWQMVIIYPLATYIKIFLALSFTSFVIVMIFGYRIRKIDTGEVLKNRE